MFILSIIIGINILGLIALLILSNQGGYWDSLIYPALERFLWSLNLSRKASKIIIIICTIVFLPALIIYFTLLIVWILLTALVVAIVERIKKKKEK